MLWLLTALAAPPDALATGRAIYAAKCQACHGPNGAGDGPAAKALPKPPADLSDPEYWKKTDPEQVRAIITSGKPGTIMRGFPMKPTKMSALLTYLQSLPKTE